MMLPYWYRGRRRSRRPVGVDVRAGVLAFWGQSCRGLESRASREGGRSQARREFRASNDFRLAVGPMTNGEDSHSLTSRSIVFLKGEFTILLLTLSFCSPFSFLLKVSVPMGQNVSYQTETYRTDWRLIICIYFGLSSFFFWTET
jgi:hypothetical protein